MIRTYSFIILYLENIYYKKPNLNKSALHSLMSDGLHCIITIQHALQLFKNRGYLNVHWPFNCWQWLLRLDEKQKDKVWVDYIEEFTKERAQEKRA